MMTELRTGHSVESDGFVFTLHELYIRVDNLDGDLVAYLPVLNENGHRVVRNQEQFETEVAFWLKDNR